MKITEIGAKTIPDAWFLCIDAAYNCVAAGTGREYPIDHGSFKGQKRRELNFVVINIEYPGAKPLVPDIPPGVGIPPPTTIEYVEKNYYPRYLMSDVVEGNEQYTYGERLLISRDKIIARYIKYGYNNNQQIMAVGQPSDIDLEDPPCLRHVDTKISDGKLHFIIYFRSWDLWSGFPNNLAGLQLFKQDMVEKINAGVSQDKQIKDGEIIITCKSLHLYGYAMKLAQARLGKIQAI